MRVAIFGAGAIGGFVAARLHMAGAAEVTLLARGAHLAAMRAGGLTLISGGETRRLEIPCAGDPSEAGIQDYVVLTLKANSLPAAAGQIARLMDRRTTLVTLQNGMPYWFFHRHDSTFRDRAIESVDPGGVLWRTLPPAQAVGGVVYPAASVIEPGVVRHTFGDHFILGEPDGAASDRIRTLSALFEAAGLQAPVRPDIRDEIWIKLFGNLAFNPISALTGSTLERMAGRPELQPVARAMIAEAIEVARALGMRRAVDIEERLEVAHRVGPHKTSMLQDLERGRPMEIDAVLGAVVELGRLTGRAMPTCEMVLAMTRERARLAGCYPDE